MQSDDRTDRSASLSRRAVRFAIQRSGGQRPLPYLSRAPSPFLPVSRELHPRAVFQMLLDGLFQRSGEILFLGARGVFRLLCQFAG